MPKTTEITKKKRRIFSFCFSYFEKHKRISLESFRILLSVFAEWSQVQIQELSAHNTKRYTIKYIDDECVCESLSFSLSLSLCLLSMVIRFVFISSHCAALYCVVLVLNEHVKFFKMLLSISTMRCWKMKTVRSSSTKTGFCVLFQFNCRSSF